MGERDLGEISTTWSRGVSEQEVTLFNIIIGGKTKLKNNDLGLGWGKNKSHNDVLTANSYVRQSAAR